MNVENTKFTLWFRDHHCHTTAWKNLNPALTSDVLHLSRKKTHKKNKNFHLEAVHRNHTPVFCVLFIPAIPDELSCYYLSYPKDLRVCKQIKL